MTSSENLVTSRPSVSQEAVGIRRANLLSSLALFGLLAIGGCFGDSKNDSPSAPPAQDDQSNEPNELADFAPPVNAGAGAYQGDGSGAGIPASPPMQAAANISSQLQLPDGLASEQLTQFLGSADSEIQRLGSTQITTENRDALIVEIKRVAMLKQEAAERLLNDPTVDQTIRDLGTRARLQAFSHRAALGDLQAAEQLEEFATELLASPSNEIARDCRTILVGFALERLQSGLTTDPAEVLERTQQLVSQPELLDGSSVKVMQQTMSVLGQYGYADAAETVRGLIETSFTDTPDSQIAAMVQEVLAAARFNALQAMQAEIMEADSQTPDAWEREAEAVAAKNADMVTLQYLASLALQLEAMEKIEAASAIYKPIQTYLANSTNLELAAAANDAIAAFSARKLAIGKQLALNGSPTLSGQPLNADQLQGKITLMPFWAVEQIDSLSSLGSSEQIAASSAGAIQILGVNMDVTPAGQAKARELASIKMNWPNIAAVPAQNSGNPFETSLAKELGIVSLPVIVVLDRDGKVASVALGPAAVEKALDGLTQ